MDIVSYAIGYSKGVSDAPTPTPDPDTPEKYNLTEINGEFYIQGDEVKIRRNDVYTANIGGSDLYYHGASVIKANGNNDTAYKYTKVSASYSGDIFIVDFDEHGDILKFDDIECVLINNVLYSTSKTEYKTLDSYESRSYITFVDYADDFDHIWLTDVTVDWFCLRVDKNFSLDGSSAYMNIGDDNKCYHGSTLNWQTYSIYKPVLFADLSNRLLAFDSEGYPIYTNKFVDDDGNAYYDPYFFAYDGHTYMWFNTINDPSVRSKLVFDDFDDPVDYSALGLITVSNVPMNYGGVESTGFIREIDMSDPRLDDINRFDPSMPFILTIINDYTGANKYINGALLMPYMTNEHGVYKFSKLYELLESYDGVPTIVDGEFVVVTDRRYLAYFNGLLIDIHRLLPDDYFIDGAEHVEYFWEPQYPDLYVGNYKYVFKKSFKHLDMYDSTRYNIINTLTNRTYHSIGDLFNALHIEDGFVTVPEYEDENFANSDYEVVDNHDYFYLNGVLFSMQGDFE